METANPPQSPQSMRPVIGSCGIDEITYVLIRFSVSPATITRSAGCENVSVDGVGVDVGAGGEVGTMRVTGVGVGRGAEKPRVLEIGSV